MFNCAARREEHYKEISLARVGNACSVWATQGLPLLTACVLSRSTLHRLQVALHGNCLRQALGCMHFPGLSRGGSSSWVLHKGTDSVRPAFCAFPGLSSSGDQVLGEHTPQVGSVSYHLPHPSCLVSWVHSRSAISSVLCISSGERMYGCDSPGSCQLSRIPGKLGLQLGACMKFVRGCSLWGRVCPSPSGSDCCPPASLPLAGDGPFCSWLALLWYLLSPSFCDRASSALG